MNSPDAHDFNPLCSDVGIEVGIDVGIDFGTLRNIAVFRALQLGDLLCIVPALRALRRAAPLAKITLIGLPWASSFAARFGKYIDDYLMFPGFPGLPETSPQIGKLPDFFASAQGRQFDLALQLHGSGALSNPITVALGAKRNAGFYVAKSYCPDEEYFAHWSQSEHEVMRYLRLLNFLGVEVSGTADDTALEFPLHEADFQELRQALRAAGQNLPGAGKYVCIHPGARAPSRRWPAERFAQVAATLMHQGLQVVLTGSAEERSIVDAVLAELQTTHGMTPIDMCGRTDLGALATLIAGARMVVCNDTGISHIAVAVATPSVIICSGADPLRWAPLDKVRHRTLFASVPCRPCSYTACPIAGHPCATSVSVEDVLEAMRLCAPGSARIPTAPDYLTPASISGLEFVSPEVDIRRIKP